MKNPLLHILALLLSAFLVPLNLQAQSTVQTEHLDLALLVEQDGAVPGETLALGILLEPEEGWHTYWRNPGDTGLPTRVSWTLPEGMMPGELQWPLPERADYQGLTNYGYKGPALLIAELQVPAGYTPARLDIAAQVDWLVCEEICIPGRTELSLSLPVGSAALPSQDAGRFAAARERQPRPLTFASASFEFGAEAVIRIHGVEQSVLEARNIRFFPLQPGYANNAVPARVIRAADGLLVQAELKEASVRVPEQLEGVLVFDTVEGARAVQFTAQPDPNLIAGSSAAAPASQGLLLVLFFALLGGLILNLMPCVFPILSLKALSIVESSHYAARDRRWHGLAYTGGVLLCFLVIAGLLLALRAAGQEIGWGFQLQSPVFVAALAYLLFVLGLSLSGFVELGTSLMRVGNLAQDTTGARGSFLTGALAVVVATPCTAPFMGTAMGAALTLPAALALLVFLALGLGLALPILLVSFIPALAHRFPRPGAWMVTFKEFLAFPLYLTVIWLLWVLTRQTDASTLALVLIGLVLITFALWLWKRARQGEGSRLGRGLALLVGILALALLPLQIGGSKAAPLLEAQPWSNAALTAARSSGRPVFVNFTADWCITCKVNERIVLETRAVAELFTAQDLVYLRADWTNADENITRELARFGRSGVPLYLVYVPGKPEPEILPQILTLGVLERALRGETL